MEVPGKTQLATRVEMHPSNCRGEINQSCLIKKWVAFGVEIIITLPVHGLSISVGQP